MVADDVYMYVLAYIRVYALRACFSSVRHCVRRVTGGCYRFWKEKEEQEKDDGEKEEKQEEKKQEGK